VAKRIDPPAILQLVETLQPVLLSRGFSRLSDKSQWTGKFNVLTWVRRTWREDALRLGWRKPPIASYFIDAQWSVPRTGAGLLLGAGLNASYARRGRRDMNLPSHAPVIRSFVEKRWCSEAVADVEFAIAWCDQCSTIDGALAELVRPERAGPGVGTEAYAHLERYIRNHAPQK
jgi:hypothetical protein